MSKVQYTLFLVSMYSAMSAFERRDADHAEKLFRWQETTQGTASTRVGEQFGFFEGWLALLRGKMDESLQNFSEHVALRGKTALKDTIYMHNFALLAEVYRQRGDYQQGIIAIEDAFCSLDRMENYWHLAEMYRIKGELLLGQGTNLSEAEACLHQALEISRRQDAKSLELRAAMSLARLWDRQDKRREAYDLLTGVYNWFTEGFDTADLKEAKALLTQLQT